jgi:hypothetical protein
MHSFSITTRDFVQGLISGHFPGHDFSFLAELFHHVDDLFAGHYPGYQRSDSAYHDLHHTCGAAEATARLLDGHLVGGLSPTLTARDLELAIAAALLHDSGYIKQLGDNEGTGAKYTLTHVQRSAEFAVRFLPPLGVTPDEVRVVQNAIHCTGVGVCVSRLPFRTPAERYLGCAVGTGDILSQMAAPDYLEHLPQLYAEFAEAAAYAGLDGTGIGNYQNVEDLMRRTRPFYEDQVQRMLNEEWDGVHREYEHHFGGAPNPYLSLIEGNLQRIDRWLAQRAVPAAC